MLDELAAGDNKAHSRAARLRLASLAVLERTEAGGASHRRRDPRASIREDVEARNAKARTAARGRARSRRRPRRREQRSRPMQSRSAAHYTLGLTAIARERFDEAEREFLKVAGAESARGGAAQLNSRAWGWRRVIPGAPCVPLRRRSTLCRTEPAAAVLLARSLRAKANLAKAHQTLASQISPAAECRRAPHRARLGPAGSARLGRAREIIRRGAATGACVGRSTHRARDCVSCARGRSRQAQTQSTMARATHRPTAACGCSRRASPWFPAVPTKPSAFCATSSSSDPGHLEAYDLLARIYVASGDMARAHAEYQALASRSPAAAGPRTMAAMIERDARESRRGHRRLRTRAGRQSPRRRGGQQPRLDSGGRRPRWTTPSGWPASRSTR